MVEVPERNLSFELARVTETAAMAAARWQGRGDKEAADQAAVDGMRLILGSLDIDGVIVIGEGEKDNAPMLYNGERVGTGVGQSWDVAVDPVDGTTLTAHGIPGAIAVIALAERGSMYAPGSMVYMDKIAVGPESAGLIDLEAPIRHNLEQVAKARHKDLNDLTAVILDRPRNQRHIDEVRATGARIRLINDGDIAGAIATTEDHTGIDILLGIGGSPEAVITAAALSCVGGEIQCRLWPRDESERQYANENGHDLERVLTITDLVASDRVLFAATGVTGGEFLEGVEFFGDGAITHSVLMRAKTGSVRHMTSRHDFRKLRKISALIFD
jgi:fructose-1,6-bisphosphatase II